MPAVLKKRLERAERIAVLAVGSRLRGDDAAGLLAAEELSKLIASPAVGRPSSVVGRPSSVVKIFMGETTPENLTGEIKRFKPTHLVVMDAADMGEKPGTFGVIGTDQTGGSSASTHNLPMCVVTDYLQQSVGCEAVIIGIQPQSCEFGEAVSREVAAGAKRAARALAEALPDRRHLNGTDR